MLAMGTALPTIISIYRWRGLKVSDEVNYHQSSSHHYHRVRKQRKCPRPCSGTATFLQLSGSRTNPHKPNPTSTMEHCTPPLALPWACLFVWVFFLNLCFALISFFALFLLSCRGLVQLYVLSPSYECVIYVPTSPLHSAQQASPACFLPCLLLTITTRPSPNSTLPSFPTGSICPLFFTLSSVHPSHTIPSHPSPSPLYTGYLKILMQGLNLKQ